jgi:AcrR family transcriptional regulator
MSVAAIATITHMTRWEPNAQGRLAQAALELFAERGFDRTSVAEIAARAGLTERTFFRHYTDKREVLFGGAGDLDKCLAAAVAAAPELASPLEAVAAGLATVTSALQERRPFAMKRQKILSVTPELQERELIKLASWATTIAETLRNRGVDADTATLVSEVGITVFRIAFQRWLDGPRSGNLTETFQAALDELRTHTKL